jgi:hypothetical protein
LPSVFYEMGMEEKAFLIASIQIRIEKEKAEAKKMKSKKK